MKYKTEQSQPTRYKTDICYTPSPRLHLTFQKGLYSADRKGAYVHSKDKVGLLENLKAVPVF